MSEKFKDIPVLDVDYHLREYDDNTLTLVYMAGYKDSQDEIKRLQDKCNRLIMMLRRLDPEKFPDTYFIHGAIGEKDQNGMPEKLLVVPAYGVDFSYEYVRTNKTIGPEW